MKQYGLCCLVCLLGLAACGAFSDDELKQLGRDTEIANVRTDTIRNDDREKIEILDINTFQNEDSSAAFCLRILVELQDRSKTFYQTEFFGRQPAERDSEYTGENYWNLKLPHGDLERVKITGYVIQYGVMDEDTFYVCAEECDGVKSVDELKARSFSPYPETPHLGYAFTYVDSQDGETQDYYRTIRAASPGPANVKVLD